MDIYELIGFSIGDGHIFYSKSHRKYKLELNGNVDEDYDYFIQIKDFIIKLADNKPHLFVAKNEKGRALRLEIYDKKFVEKLISLGLPSGNKTFVASIPENLTEEQMNSVVKGIFEADGCLYFSKTKQGNYPTYPRLEIKTSSEVLLKQLEDFLIKKGFDTYTRRSKTDRTPAIGVSGKVSLEKWKSIFGFISLKNKTKYGFWKTKGFYIPRTPLKNRIQYAHVA